MTTRQSDQEQGRLQPLHSAAVDGPGQLPSQPLGLGQLPGQPLGGTARGRYDRGSIPIEFLVYAVCISLLIVMCVTGARLALTTSHLGDAATSAARAASSARTATAATDAATETITSSLNASGVPCADRQITINTSAFTTPLGTPAEITVTVRCTIALSDLAAPGLPSSITRTVTATSPLDRYRQRS